jgi:hypothetical protein
MVLSGIELVTAWAFLPWATVPVPVLVRLSSSIPKQKRSRELH